MGDPFVLPIVLMLTGLALVGTVDLTHFAPLIFIIGHGVGWYNRGLH